MLHPQNFLVMGNCWCKDGIEQNDRDNINSTRAAANSMSPDSNRSEVMNSLDTTNGYKSFVSSKIDKLVLEILDVIGCIVEK